MHDALPRTIRIAAALIDDGDGRLLLVRKTGSQWFMQAGGKIDPAESAFDAVRRELYEEIGLRLAEEPCYLGCFSSVAANESGHIVTADLFHVRTCHNVQPQAEIVEAIWIDRVAAAALPLAPLTRDHVLPLSYTL